MDLTLSPDELAFRAEARAWLAAHVPTTPLPSMDTEAGFRAHQEWEALLAESGWSVVSWPRAFHGREASLVEWVIFEEEYYRAGAPGRVSQNGIFLLAPIIFDHGTPEQQERFLPTMATGEQVWAQAWSEPEAGSDLASLTSTARRDDERGGWRLDGQKTWSSRATHAQWGFGLFRSDPQAQRHAGLTYFLFPLDAEGVTVRPIRQLDGEAGFAEIFFSDVFVPDSDVLGAPGDGWRVAMSTAGNERGLSLRSPGRFCAAADRLVDLYRATPDGLATDRAADRVVDAWIKAQAYRLYTWGTVTRLARRRRPGRGRLGQQGLLVRARHRAARDRARPAGTGGRGRLLLARRLPLLAVRPDLRRHQRDPAQHRGRADPRPAPRAQRGPDVRFELTSDQRDFATSLESLLTGAGTAAVARAWADGDTGPGLELWARLAELGVTALVVPEESGGMGATPVELVVALEAIGRHAVPGPWVESVAYLPRAVASADLLGALAEGAVGSVAVPPHTPYALDADVADHLFLAADGLLATALPGDRLVSVDRARRLFRATPTSESLSHEVGDLDAAFDLAVLATAAQLLGCGERILTDSVAYVKQRRQFGREIGSYQAIKHALADVRIALDFARPLVLGAALDPQRRDVSAAKIACAEAAYLASRTGLQVHGAIGYTQELDLSLWITKVRALVTAWGTPAHHRSVVLDSLVHA